MAVDAPALCGGRQQSGFGRLGKANQAALVKAAAQAEARGWEFARAAAKGSTDTMAKNSRWLNIPRLCGRIRVRLAQAHVERSKRAGPDGKAIVKAMQ